MYPSQGVLELIENHIQNNELACYTNKHEIVGILKEAMKNGENKETQIQHTRNVREMLDKDRILTE